MKHVVIFYFFRTFADEQAVMDFAGCLSGSLGAYAVGAERIAEGGSRTYATFVRPSVFEKPLPEGQAALDWAKEELGQFDILAAETKELAIPGGQPPPFPLALAGNGQAALVETRALIVDVRQDPREE